MTLSILSASPVSTVHFAGRTEEIKYEFTIPDPDRPNGRRLALSIVFPKGNDFLKERAYVLKDALSKVNPQILHALVLLGYRLGVERSGRKVIQIEPCYTPGTRRPRLVERPHGTELAERVAAVCAQVLLTREGIRLADA